MGKFNLLSVAEDNYVSDRYTAKQDSFFRGYTSRVVSLELSVTVDKTLTINFFESERLKDKIVFPNLDIDGMIEYLQEVKTFISEEDMIKKLRGKQ